MIKIYPESAVVIPTELNNRFTRSATQKERKEINRIISQWSSIYSDPNVTEVSLVNFISERDLLLIYASCCPEIIETVLQVLTLQRQYTVNPEVESSLLFGVLFLYPELFEILLIEKGWNYRSDVSEQLENIRFYKTYSQRPKKVQRKRGYTDQGSLKPTAKRLREECLTDYYLEEYNRMIQYDQQVRDTLQILAGSLM